MLQNRSSPLMNFRWWYDVFIVSQVVDPVVGPHPRGNVGDLCIGVSFAKTSLTIRRQGVVNLPAEVLSLLLAKIAAHNSFPARNFGPNHWSAINPLLDDNGEAPAYVLAGYLSEALSPFIAEGDVDLGWIRV